MNLCSFSVCKVSKLTIQWIHLAHHYFRAQSLVGDTVARVLEQIEEQTGYIGFIALAGPDSQRSGDIKTLSYAVIICMTGCD